MPQAEPLITPDFPQDAVKKRKDPGVLVLTCEGHLLSRNPEASELCALLNKARLGKHARGVIPIEVLNVCYIIAESLSAAAGIKEGEDVGLRCFISDVRPPVLLRAIGIPCHGDIESARIIIIMDGITARKPVTIPGADASDRPGPL